MVKGETVMPVPEGNITTAEILIPVVETSTTEDNYDENQAAYDAAMADALKKVKNDLPKLS